MVTKTKAGQKKGKVKVGKLKLNKETVKDLSGSERKAVKGGLVLKLTIPCLPVLKSVNIVCRLTEGPTC